MYARYIPPAKRPGPRQPSTPAPAPALPSPPPPPVNRQQPDPPQPLLDELAVPKSKKPKKKKTNKNVKEPQDADDNGDDDETSRHVAILSKRERSMKIVETLKQSMPAKQDAEDEAVKRAEAQAKVHDIGPMPQPPRAILDTSQPAIDALPKWLTNPVKVGLNLTATFQGYFQMDPDVCKHLEAKGFQKPLPIQVAALKYLPPIPPDRIMPFPKCRDLIISAGTGSGKTLAYCLPIVRDLCESDLTSLRAVIILPTRELVDQVRKVMNLCSEAFGRNGCARLRIGTAVGNRDIAKEHLNLVGRRERRNLESDELEKPDNQEKAVEDRYAKANKLAGERFGNETPRPGYHYEYYSKVDIVIGTPDRLFEHRMFSKGFHLHNCRWIVLDEADKLFYDHHSFDRIMMRLQLSKNPFDLVHLRKIIVGATLNNQMVMLSSLSLKQPKMLVLATVGETAKLPATLKECYVKVTRDDVKPLFLFDLLKKIDAETSAAEVDGGPDVDIDHNSNVASKGSTQSVLVFARDNINVPRLGSIISDLYPDLAPQLATITSKTPSVTRRDVFSKFKSGIYRVVIASDLVARGWDMVNLQHVINYDVPRAVTDYVHRVGRTARAGRRGTAWTLVCANEMPWFKREVLGHEDVKRKKNEVSWLKIVRSQDVERVALVTHKGISAEREALFAQALGRLEQSVRGA